MPRPVSAPAPQIDVAPTSAIPRNLPPLRGWQLRALRDLEAFTAGHFLISAAPGAGKTRPALQFARREIEAGRAGSVVVACPTAPLTRQWARAAHGLGLELAPDAGSVPPGFHGIALTYARIAQDPKRLRRVSRQALVVADEAHHLGEELAWGESFGTAFCGAPRWLLLSGTPFRSDALPIPGVRYGRDGLACPDVAYSYADAVRDRVCRPVTFIAYDGTLSWQSGEDVIESSFETVLSTREAARRYRTAISTELPDGLPRILGEADQRLVQLRRDGHRDAGGLVVAADSAHARQIARLLRETTGRAPVVVLHQEPRAAAKLVQFTGSLVPWLVAVNMVSEGVDIPRLRVGVYATAAKTPLIFRQIVGRFVRTLPGRAAEPSWLYIPADPVLRDHAAAVQEDLRGALRECDATGGTEDLEQPSERQAAEPGSEPLFVPLSADVAPQLTLFGGPAPAPRPAPAPAVAVASEATEPSIPAFETRSLLRAERHRLVAELSRKERSTHQQINRWVNDRVGVTSVQKATLDQLERSVELLVGRLMRRR